MLGDKALCHRGTCICTARGACFQTFHPVQYSLEYGGTQGVKYLLRREDGLMLCHFASSHHDKLADQPTPGGTLQPQAAQLDSPGAPHSVHDAIHARPGRGSVYHVGYTPVPAGEPLHCQTAVATTLGLHCSRLQLDSMLQVCMSTTSLCLGAQHMPAGPHTLFTVGPPSSTWHSFVHGETQPVQEHQDEQVLSEATGCTASAASLEEFAATYSKPSRGETKGARAGVPSKQPRNPRFLSLTLQSMPPCPSHCSPHRLPVCITSKTRHLVSG